MTELAWRAQAAEDLQTGAVLLLSALFLFGAGVVVGRRR